MKPYHFALFEIHVSEYCLVKLCQTQIATIERAVYKLEFRKVTIGKIAIIENAVLIFPFCE
ncbi:hypothetical protein SDC9_201419 [bioreactor metagenome]|uniref:Uncharacterized protein n=1 Tax=bioreactor metagenome TaxID=1076179 RepID=A0A645J2R9_9ZZZZ